MSGGNGILWQSAMSMLAFYLKLQEGLATNLQQPSAVSCATTTPEALSSGSMSCHQGPGAVMQEASPIIQAADTGLTALGFQQRHAHHRLESACVGPLYKGKLRGIDDHGSRHWEHMALANIG